MAVVRTTTTRTVALDHGKGGTSTSAASSEISGQDQQHVSIPSSTQQPPSSKQAALLNKNSDGGFFKVLISLCVSCCCPSFLTSTIKRLTEPITNMILSYLGILQTVQSLLMNNPLTDFLKKHFLKILAVLIYLFMAFVISSLTAMFVVMAILFYRRPPTQYDHPLFFIKEDKSLYANVTLLPNDSSRSLIQSGLFIDTFRIKLNLPESAANRKVGMFTVHADFYDRNNMKLFTTSRSSMIKYNSNIIRTVKDLMSIPYIIFGNENEPERQILEMLTETQLNDFNNRVILHRASHIHVWIGSPDVQIYSASIQMMAQITGIWYYFFNYPITSFFILFPIFLSFNLFGWIMFGIFLLYLIFIRLNKSQQQEPKSSFVKHKPSLSQQQIQEKKLVSMSPRSSVKQEVAAAATVHDTASTSSDENRDGEEGHIEDSKPLVVHNRHDHGDETSIVEHSQQPQLRKRVTRSKKKPQTTSTTTD
ncbi:hypothetical protein FDP41_007874 [Naegleria fowleri]|uniref:Seipin n=1 Tax=Naegleria fowleri TaxID=5763 RepID=A0A6A5CF64_NAEFO|nr:uncharacterized protein FDP41_007874 [Naegleria fowleri]KAF0983959.1 hypothetical protein FDP41_007874 [Naegleria fowleri]